MTKRYVDGREVKFRDRPAFQTLVEDWTATVPGTNALKWNKRAIGADELERRLEVGDFCGFKLKFGTIPGTFNGIEFLIPVTKDEDVILGRLQFQRRTIERHSLGPAR
jgi:hypothetical protein